MKKQYVVHRPPLSHDYNLPTQEELLAVEIGDLVKVTFCVGQDIPERIWILITNMPAYDLWQGQTDNDPIGEVTASVIPAGTLVEFHPLDVIAIN